MKTPKRYRSSVTGQFVTGKYASKHPRTTEAEQIRKSLEQIARILAKANS